jgi:hypothetical protein
MNTEATPVGSLSGAEVFTVLKASTMGFPLVSGRPWHFSCTATAIELHAPRAGPRGSDQRDRHQRLACGAALLNLRVQIRALGVHTTVRLYPNSTDPDMVAIVLPQGRAAATAGDHVMADAMDGLHAHETFLPRYAATPGLVNRLRRVARIEQAWLAVPSATQQHVLMALLTQTENIADPLAGVTFDAAAYPTAANENPDDRPYPAVLAVIGTVHDGPTAQVQAGQALQRVLLTAVSTGVDSQLLPDAGQQPSTRTRLRTLIGGGLWPQIVLRLGQEAEVTQRAAS